MSRTGGAARTAPGDDDAPSPGVSLLLEDSEASFEPLGAGHGGECFTFSGNFGAKAAGGSAAVAGLPEFLAEAEAPHLEPAAEAWCSENGIVTADELAYVVEELADALTVRLVERARLRRAADALKVPPVRLVRQATRPAARQRPAAARLAPAAELGSQRSSPSAQPRGFFFGDDLAGDSRSSPGSTLVTGRGVLFEDTREGHGSSGLRAASSGEVPQARFAPSTRLGKTDLWWLAQPLLKGQEVGSISKEQALVNVQRALGQEGASPHEWCGPMPPLKTAIEACCTELVAALLIAGADPEVRDAAGVSALHAAARCGSCDIIQLLLGAGADANVTDDHGQTPLFSAPSRSVCRTLLRHAPADEPLDTGHVNANGQTALHLAARARCDDVILWLCDNMDPDCIDIRDNLGFTARDYASRSGVRSSVLQRMQEAAGSERPAHRAQQSPQSQSRLAAPPVATASGRGHSNCTYHGHPTPTPPMKCGHTPQQHGQYQKHPMVMSLLRKQQEQKAAARGPLSPSSASSSTSAGRRRPGVPDASGALIAGDGAGSAGQMSPARELIREVQSRDRGAGERPVAPLAGRQPGVRPRGAGADETAAAASPSLRRGESTERLPSGSPAGNHRHFHDNRQTKTSVNYYDLRAEGADVSGLQELARRMDQLQTDHRSLQDGLASLVKALPSCILTHTCPLPHVTDVHFCLNCRTHAANTEALGGGAAPRRGRAEAPAGAEDARPSSRSVSRSSAESPRSRQASRELPGRDGAPPVDNYMRREEQRRSSVTSLASGASEAGQRPSIFYGPTGMAVPSTSSPRTSVQGTEDVRPKDVDDPKARATRALFALHALLKARGGRPDEPIGDRELKKLVRRAGRAADKRAEVEVGVFTDDTSSSSESERESRPQRSRARSSKAQATQAFVRDLRRASEAELARMIEGGGGGGFDAVAVWQALEQPTDSDEDEVPTATRAKKVKELKTVEVTEVSVPASVLDEHQQEADRGLTILSGLLRARVAGPGGAEPVGDEELADLVALARQGARSLGRARQEPGASQDAMAALDRAGPPNTAAAKQKIKDFLAAHTAGVENPIPKDKAERLALWQSLINQASGSEPETALRKLKTRSASKLRAPMSGKAAERLKASRALIVFSSLLQAHHGEQPPQAAAGEQVAPEVVTECVKLADEIAEAMAADGEDGDSDVQDEAPEDGDGRRLAESSGAARKTISRYMTGQGMEGPVRKKTLSFEDGRWAGGDGPSPFDDDGEDDDTTVWSSIRSGAMAGRIRSNTAEAETDKRQNMLLTFTEKAASSKSKGLNGRNMSVHFCPDTVSPRPSDGSKEPESQQPSPRPSPRTALLTPDGAGAQETPDSRHSLLHARTPNWEEEEAW